MSSSSIDTGRPPPGGDEVQHAPRHHDRATQFQVELGARPRPASCADTNEVVTVGDVGVKDGGPWQPLPVAEAVALFKPATVRWWLSGGHALEAHLGDSWRTHDDTDIGIVRTQALHLPTVLHDWDIFVAAAGVLRHWTGQPLDARRSENNLWCRPTPDSPWMLDVTVGDGDEDEWVYRRDATVRRRWNEAVLVTADDVPYLAPELQMLFKSTAIRPKDDLDAAHVIPRLDPARRAWLKHELPYDHPWQRHAVGGEEPGGH